MKAIIAICVALSLTRHAVGQVDDLEIVGKWKLITMEFENNPQKVDLQSVLTFDRSGVLCSARITPGSQEPQGETKGKYSIDRWTAGRTPGRIAIERGSRNSIVIFKFDEKQRLVIGSRKSPDLEPPESFDDEACELIMVFERVDDN